jgi:high frequency lysogenization protein|tara:strand:+ start:1004 stop:1696 length:693 start_codon:yes stop_codon:yes gene_type:complete
LNNSGLSYSSWERENIALAAVAQCAAVVDKLATKGYADPYQLAASINPLLVLDPDSFSDVYPNLIDLSFGFRTAQDIFSNDRAKTESAALRYTLGLLHIRGALERNGPMQERIRNTLTKIAPLSGAEAPQQLITEASDPATEADRLILKQLAELYQDTISTLSYRIQIQGKSEHLKNDDVANSIRAVLLSGIRSAVLWQQLGGRRWRLLIYRKRICETATHIRKKLIHSI